jgi:hypothetical protein
MAPGRKTGGRKKGTPNRVTAEARSIFAQVLEKTAPEMQRWFSECGDGIEIEKTTIAPDGTPVTVLGRMNADPGKALDLMIKLAEYHFPKLQRMEKGIADATDEELLQEVQRRKAEAEKAE